MTKIDTMTTEVKGKEKHFLTITNHIDKMEFISISKATKERIDKLIANGKEYSHTLDKQFQMG